jgi:hypothetical protein
VVRHRPRRRALDQGVAVPEAEADRDPSASSASPAGPDGRGGPAETEGVSRAERLRKNAEYGGTWNGKKYGGWPREHISDWVFPSRTNPANSMADFFGKEDAVMKALTKVEDFDPARSAAHGVDRGERDVSEPVGRPAARTRDRGCLEHL